MLQKKHILFGSTFLLYPVLAAGAVDPIERFVGQYKGHVVIVDSKHEVDRDLGVDITKTETGFNVRWRVSAQKIKGRIKTKEYSVDFVPTGRPNVYAAAMKRNVFGTREPLDPMKGDPYVWSRISADTLTLFALLITDDGGYEVQVYDRTLVPEGLALKYSRIRDGQPLRTIETTLVRQ